MVEDPNPLGSGVRKNEPGNEVGTSHRIVIVPILVDEHSDFFLVSPRQLQGITSLRKYYYYERKNKNVLQKAVRKTKENN